MLQSTISTRPAVEIVCVLQVKGNITYNGKNFHEFQAVHTSAYVDQNDLHQAELTVRETLDFAARCQGIGHKGGQPLLHCRSVFAASSCAVIWICSHISVADTSRCPTDRGFADRHAQAGYFWLIPQLVATCTGINNALLASRLV